jgi:predicted dehydrogenase
MAKKIRAAVIGLGAISGAHTGVYRKSPHAELAGICDVAEVWLKQCQRDWDVPFASTDWKKIVANPQIDAISICLPPPFHAPVTIAALRAGKHVLCEKPPALNAAEAKRMAAAAKKARKVFMVAFGYRFWRTSQQLKRLMADGTLGEIYLARAVYRRQLPGLPPPTMGRPDGETYNRNWFNERAKGGGALLDLGCHVCDLALYFMGFPKVQSVLGAAYNKFLPQFLKGTRLPSDADDHSAGMVKFANGALLEIEASYGCHGPGVMAIELMGDKGAAVLDGEGVRIFGQAGPLHLVGRVTGDESPERGVAEHFIEVVRRAEKPIITPEHAVTVMEILDGIYKSGGWTMKPPAKAGRKS